MTLLLQEMLVHASAGPAFRSTWRTAAAGETVTLPLSGGAGSAYNFVVDWDDGTVETITSATDPKRIHTYATPRDHQISITGTITGWAFNNAGDKLKIRSIDQWGCLRFTQSQTGHFYGCSNLTVPATDTPVLSVSCANMFRGASAFNQDISLWNTSSVVDFGGMFYDAILFNQNINLWNTSSCTNMGNMFRGATKFNQNISSWNTSAVKFMSYMFFSASSFNQNIGSWNTSSVTSMLGMFNGAVAFNQDISSWSTAAVQDMSSMFRGAAAFNCGQTAGSVHSLMNRTATGGWRIGSKTTAHLNYMFFDAKSFAGDISSWCATAATSLPTNFAVNTHANFNAATMSPTWGACPIPD